MVWKLLLDLIKGRLDTVRIGDVGADTDGLSTA